LVTGRGAVTTRTTSKYWSRLQRSKTRLGELFSKFTPDRGKIAGPHTNEHEI